MEPGKRIILICLIVAGIKVSGIGLPNWLMGLMALCCMVNETMSQLNSIQWFTRLLGEREEHFVMEIVERMETQILNFLWACAKMCKKLPGYFWKMMVAARDTLLVTFRFLLSFCRKEQEGEPYPLIV